MVGGRRIELLTSSVSRKRSPTELTARVVSRNPAAGNPQSIAKGPAAVKGFARSPICPPGSAYLRSEKSGTSSRCQALFTIIAVAA